ncbi:MAG: acyl-CoA thioesterase [Immundisolibacteraceae bacterium]|nr:acyl-CoA thioesterase [Immundisolibacteraceae bacterium]
MISATITTEIQFYHLDPMKVVWHGNYPEFFEQARSRLLTRLNYNYAEMEASGFLWPIVTMEIKYVRPLVLGQKISVTATLIEFEQRMKIRYLIVDADSGQRLTKAVTTMVAVDEKSGQMCFGSPQIFLDKVAQWSAG